VPELPETNNVLSKWRRRRMVMRMGQALPVETIRSFHAHIYFRDAREREQALQLREYIAERFSVQLGRIHDLNVGPHNAPMYQVAFAPSMFADFVSFLMLNHAQLSVLIHPNTGRARTDHLVHAAWLGERLPVRGDVLTDDPEGDVISPVVPNTMPGGS
jgi:aromatic ring-cleaving dioxygenase